MQVINSSHTGLNDKWSDQVIQMMLHQTSTENQCRKWDFVVLRRVAHTLLTLWDKRHICCVARCLVQFPVDAACTAENYGNSCMALLGPPPPPIWGGGGGKSLREQIRSYNLNPGFFADFTGNLIPAPRG